MKGKTGTIKVMEEWIYVIDIHKEIYILHRSSNGGKSTGGSPPRFLRENRDADVREKEKNSCIRGKILLFLVPEQKMIF
jgi:hypothetical protein